MLHIIKFPHPTRFVPDSPNFSDREIAHDTVTFPNELTHSHTTCLSTMTTLRLTLRLRYVELR